ncbi:TraB/GumN family protein [Tahibacter harae]|uniref:TraB/GumN family protein n=1 Tax=Tahibacter harae TaxID=2963937 RepID=A0ABT1QTT3_9GAMM|nr:TraB/GumN family protein [Tahibacter harae]MCQ4165712.1 TraB/GumN family protein [Tahibacter harae]
MLRATLSLCLSFCIFTAHAAAPETAPATPSPAVAVPPSATTATAVPSAPAPAAVLETVVVSGEQPGPGLWKISKGEHVLWILGTLSPLPKKISWVSREVESVIAGAQQVLLPPQASVKIKGGMVGGLFLLPSLLKARNNPDGKRLADVVPPDLYARWQPLKQKYLGRDQGVEKRRPIFAASELYGEALDKAGLRGGGKVADTVEKLAERHKVELVRPEVALKLDGARDTLRDFAKSELDDIDCLRRTVDRLESDLPAMQLRANAWAVGDIEALRALPYVDQNQACTEAMLQNSAVQEHGMGDLRERVARAWLESAETALARHTVSLAVLPMDQILGADGYVAELQRRGYTVQPPE